MVVMGVTYAEKKTAGSAILAARKTLADNNAIVPLGEYRGFQMELSFDPFYKDYTVKLSGVRDCGISLGTNVFGNIQRLDNLLNNFEYYK